MPLKGLMLHYKLNRLQNIMQTPYSVYSVCPYTVSFQWPKDFFSFMLHMPIQYCHVAICREADGEAKIGQDQRTWQKAQTIFILLAKFILLPLWKLRNKMTVN